MGDFEWLADTLGQPLNEVVLLCRRDFDRVAHFRGIHRMRKAGLAYKIRIVSSVYNSPSISIANLFN